MPPNGCIQKTIVQRERERGLLLYQVGTKAAPAQCDENSGQIILVRRATLTSMREAMTCSDYRTQAGSLAQALKKPASESSL